MTTRTTTIIGRYRRARMPRAVLALAFVVLAVQFTLVQHAVEHWGAAPEVGCEVCVAGAHHVPAVAGVPVAPEVHAFIEDGLPPAIGFTPRLLHGAHRARAPPVVS
jgi:hypothetical protein